MYLLCNINVSSSKIMHALSSEMSVLMKFNLVVMTIQKSCGFIASITPVEKQLQWPTHTLLSLL